MMQHSDGFNNVEGAGDVAEPENVSLCILNVRHTQLLRLRLA